LNCPFCYIKNELRVRNVYSSNYIKPQRLLQQKLQEKSDKIKRLFDINFVYPLRSAAGKSKSIIFSLSKKLF